MKQDVEKEYLESFEAYSDAIYRFASFQTSNREIAKDIAQDVFLSTWKYLAGGGKVENMRAFLYALTRNKVIDWRRKKKEESLESLGEVGFDAIDEHAQRNIERSAEARRVFRLIGAMEEGTREPMLLRFVEGLSVKEIGEILGESENAISVRIHRGIKKLQKIMQIS